MLSAFLGHASAIAITSPVVSMVAIRLFSWSILLAYFLFLSFYTKVIFKLFSCNHTYFKILIYIFFRRPTYIEMKLVDVAEKQRELPTFPQSFPMNGGDGPHSYIHNSSYQVCT